MCNSSGPSIGLRSFSKSFRAGVVRELPGQLGLITYLVGDYDDALAYFTTKLGFDLVADEPRPGGSRWIVVAPPGAATALLLAQTDPGDESVLGRQAGSKVAFFLHTEDFAGSHERMVAAGVEFLEEPRHESYGSVAVFRDLYGNRWDLIQPVPAPGSPSTSDSASEPGDWSKAQSHPVNVVAGDAEGPVIRRAVPSEYGEVARIAVSSYLTAGYFDDEEHPYMLQLADTAHRAGQAAVWIAERAGKVVGSVTVMTSDDGFAQIAREGEVEFRLLVVDPGAQRSGAGSALVHAVEEHARSRGASAVVLTTGPSGTAWEPAHALYRRRGYTRAPERDWAAPDGMVLEVYRKVL